MEMFNWVMATKPADIKIQAWARLITAQKRAMSIVEHDIKAAGHPPLAWYDVLLALEKAGEEGMRPGELEAILLLSQYGLSRLLARMADSGYVEKLPCKDDGRGQILRVTALGRKTRLDTWPVFGVSIEKAVGSKLTSDEASRLYNLLGKLV